MTMEAEGNGRYLRWRVDRLEERVEDIEELEPKLMAERMGVLNQKVDRLTGVVIKVGVSIVASAIVFAFTVFALIGGPS